MSKNNVSKLTTTQNVIRNKFKKAYMNRLENEDDVICARKPIQIQNATSVDLESKSNGFSHHKLLKTITTNTSPLLHPITKSHSNHTIKKKQYDSNTLCDILKIVLATSPTSTNSIDMRMHQINAILDELCELRVI